MKAKIFQKLSALFLCVAVLLSGMVFTVGVGAADAIEIDSEADLIAMADNLAGNYVLTEDIKTKDLVLRQKEN